MIVLVSNDGIDWSLDFGQDSVTLTEKDLVQEMTISSQEVPLAAWSLCIVSKTTVLKQPSSACSSYPYQARNT